VGQNPRQRCTSCSWRQWLNGERHSTCPRCEEPVEDRLERRLQSKAGFATKKAAHEALARVVTSLGDGTHVVTQHTTVREFCEQWLTLQTGRVKASTLYSYRHNLEHYLIPRIGDVRLQKLTAGRLTQVYAELAASGGRNGAPLSLRTVQYVHATIRKALNDAVRQGVIARNVALMADLPRHATRGCPGLPQRGQAASSVGSSPGTRLREGHQRR
jgi:hypothetical protein